MYSIFDLVLKREKTEVPVSHYKGGVHRIQS